MSFGPSDIQTNFTAGELTPMLAGRSDLDKYHNGVSILENMIIHPTGGACRRSGLRWVAEVKDSTKAVRLIPFQFSITQAYIIEVGDLYMRFYRDEGRIESPPGTPVEIVTTYAEADLFDLKFTQSADTLYIAHPTYPPRKVTRSSHTSWSITTISFTANPFGSANNYPRAVSLYEERSVWGGTNNEPQTLFFSQSGDFENMTTGTGDDDGMEFVIAADQVNVIQWISAGDTLFIGTVGGEFEGHGTTPDQPITPTSVQINRQTTHGSSNVVPLRVGRVVLFVQRSKRKLLEFTFNIDVNGFVAPDMTILADHLTKSGIKDMDYSQHPDSVVWVATEDGKLLGLTYYRPEDVVGWTNHPIGGDGLCESVAIIPDSGETHDQLWVLVNRTIDGATKRYIEFMEETFDADDDIEDAFFLDSALSYDGVPNDTMSGLDHLEGEIVSILADGAVHESQEVVSGAITLDAEHSKVHAGLPYTSIVETMDLEPDQQSAIGKTARIHDTILQLYDSVGGRMGPSSDNMEQIPTFADGIIMDNPPARFTGKKELPFDGDYTQSLKVRVEQDIPLPFNLLSIIHRYGVAPEV